MIVDFTGGIPHIAIPAFVGSIATELMGFSDAWAPAGAIVGVVIYYIGKLIVAEIHKPTHRTQRP